MLRISKINICKRSCLHHVITCTSIRTLTSTTAVAQTKLKSYKDIPGPPGIPYLGNFLGFKNPEHGHDPKYILQTAKHLWNTYGDMFKLEVPGKAPIIW